ncbi:RluA family pseudouridine synthase [Deltaproteobacteria bacterium OttesenSCG-928-K17]|nr:RluA family pseudouridine synthase [Deltaproteobacteria bacterium OttesenSCG-928-K17]
MKKRFSRDRLKEAALKKEGLPDGDPSFDVEDSMDAELEEDLAEADHEDAAEGRPGYIQVVVRAEEAGRRLDALLSARHSEFTRTQLARLAKEGLISVDNKAAKPGAIMNAGQTIIFQAPAPPLTDLKPEPGVKLDVIYEDEHILAVNKQCGLAVHPAPGYHGPTLVGGLLARDAALAGLGEHHRPGLVHRLDKDTSGVLVIARTEAALGKLSAAFSARETTKHYLAFVKGRPKNGRGLIDSPIGRHPTQRHKMAAGLADGRPAQTLWRMLKTFPKAGVSLVMLKLISGRTHQARVHLQSLGVPVLADPVYSRGVAELLKLCPQAEAFLQRQMLHARRLTIAHPATGQPITLRAPWPDDFVALFKLLSLYERSEK